METNVNGFLEQAKQQEAHETQVQARLAEWQEQRTDDWYKDRLGRFTASEIWKLTVKPKDPKNEFSVAFMDYVWDKVAETLTQWYDPNKRDSAATRWGKDHEELAKVVFTKVTGLLVNNAGFIKDLIDPDHVGCSPDGLIGDDAGVEIKCPYDSRVHLEHRQLRTPADLKRLNRDYYWQVIHCMITTERSTWFFVSFDPRFKDERMLHIIRFEWAKVEADIDFLVEQIQKAIKEKERILQVV